MNTSSLFAGRLLAALGALAITATLVLGSFSADPAVQNIAGVIA